MVEASNEDRLKMAEKTKVMVIDDSALTRQVLSDILQTDYMFEILDSASDPIFAMSLRIGAHFHRAGHIDHAANIGWNI